MADDAHEEWLQGRRNGRLDPLGRALRDIYPADNHDTLDSDVTGLMIDLSKLPYQPAAPRVAAAPPPLADRQRPSIASRIGGLLRRRS